MLKKLLEIFLKKTAMLNGMATIIPLMVGLINSTIRSQIRFA